MKFIGWISIIAGAVAAISLVIQIERDDTAIMMAEAAVWSVACFAFGGGVLKRKKFAWPLGMALIVLQVLTFWKDVTPVVLQESPGSRMWLLAMTSAAGAALAIGWGCFWYTRRQYFLKQ